MLAGSHAGVGTLLEGSQAGGGMREGTPLGVGTQLVGSLLEAGTLLGAGSRLGEGSQLGAGSQRAGRIQLGDIQQEGGNPEVDMPLAEADNRLGVGTRLEVGSPVLPGSLGHSCQDPGEGGASSQEDRCTDNR